MRKQLLSIAALMVFPLAAHAVTFGQPDNGAHPYVGTLAIRLSDGISSCTGTLISPTVVVTAAHCVYGNMGIWVSFQEKVTFEDRLPGESAIDYLNRSSKWISGTGYAHPLYNPNVLVTYDVGVVVLSRPVALPTYGTLPPLGMVDTLTGRQHSKQNSFTVVGYGLQGFIKPFFSDEWERRQASTRLIELKSTFNGGLSAKFSNNPGATRGGSCYGDSGGPVFYGSSNVITAIVSWGITPCIGVDYQFRLDTAAALDFLNDYVQ